MGDGVITTDLDGRILLFNKSAEEISGFSAHEVLGRTITSVFSIRNEITGQYNFDPSYEVLHSDADIEISNQTILTAKNGELKNISDRAAAMMDEHGNKTGVVIIFRDVTEKRAMETALQKSEIHYKMLFDSMQGGYALCKKQYDENGMAYDCNIIEMNAAFEEITGMQKENCLGKSLLTLLPAYSYNKEEYKRLIKGESPVVYDMYFGNKRFVQVLAFSPMEDYFAAVITDISERKRMEKEIFDEKERLRITFASISDGVITTDVHKKITMLNNMAEFMTGVMSQEAIGKNFHDVFFVSSQGKQVSQSPVDEVLRTDKVCEPVSQTVLTAADGTKRHISQSAAPIKDENGTTTGVVTVFRDMTERKEYADKIIYLSLHDGLTGLYNRSYFEQEIRRLDKEKLVPVSVVMGDINGLKLLNDVYGHQAGDDLLKTIAEILTGQCESNHIIARWGGDEFAVIMPGTTEDKAENTCKRIRKACEESDFEPIILSISLGVSTKTNPDTNLKSVLKDAEDRMYSHKLIEGKQVRSTIISSLQKTLFDKSCETEQHAERMLVTAEKFGQVLCFNKYEMEELKLLTLLHDVGKIGIPDTILNKPEALSVDEWYEMKKHPEIGYRIAQSTNELSHIADLILTHHERWDGKGYPQGLSGEYIPLLSRVLSIVDAYDVMTNVRPYKKVLTKPEAIHEIHECAGTQFDPALVEIFVTKIVNEN